MPSPFYRSSTGGGGGGGKGVSSDGYDGAESFFEQLKTVANELKLPFMPSGAAESAAAKAAVDAYMTARNGTLSPAEAFFYQGESPGEFPELEITQPGTDSPIGDIGKALNDFMANMGDMLNELLTSPVGLLGSFLNFLFKLFTTVVQGISQVVQETARAAAAAIEDAWKKQMEMASAAGQTGLQPLELYNQAATTQTLSHSLKNTAGT